ncbi:MAG: choice-of-anchor tandem repeat GloVer-containing protein [Candidatus Sulfotelmatobacter sp.]
MQRRKLSIPVLTALAAFMVVSMAGTSLAQTETVLFNFSGTSGGNRPQSTLIFDSAGNLYGTTYSGGYTEGGPYLGGAAFQLKPKEGGGWTETVMHNFGASGDGTFLTAGLVSDGAGKFYGTTVAGGTYGYGTVFQLRPTKTGWAEQIIHSFNNNGKDGEYPYGSLIIDSAGNLYGTTKNGGFNYCVYLAASCGTVFELSTKTGAEKILHDFQQDDNIDGYYPVGSLIFDSAGDLYGTTSTGGSGFQGVVFELSPRAGKPWQERILHNFTFNGTDGANPVSSLVMDSAGNLYGTTSSGGNQPNGLGTVFELSPTETGPWTETFPHDFSFCGDDGCDPVGNLILDGAGNLYGTAESGGNSDGGVVFELSPVGGGTWSDNVLVTFNSLGSAWPGGENPEAGLVFDGAGNLYGTAYDGGEFSVGTVFEITP